MIFPWMEQAIFMDGPKAEQVAFGRWGWADRGLNVAVIPTPRYVTDPTAAPDTTAMFRIVHYRPRFVDGFPSRDDEGRVRLWSQS